MSDRSLVESNGHITPGQGSAVLPYDPLGGGSAYWCSLVPKTEEQQAQVFAMREGEHKSLKESVNLTVDLVHVLAHDVTIQKETGEIIEGIRIVLLDADGTTYACVSQGIRDTLRTLFQVYGTPDTWKSPKRFTVKLLPLSGGRQILKLMPVALPPRKSK